MYVRLNISAESSWKLASVSDVIAPALVDSVKPNDVPDFTVLPST